MKKLLIKLLLETEPSFAHGHSSQAKVYPFAGKRKYLHSPVVLRPWIQLWLQELNQQTPALQASALPTELYQINISYNLNHLKDNIQVQGNLIFQETRIAERRFFIGLQRGYFF